MIQIELLRVRLAMEVLAYCSYYFLCLSFQFSMYFVVSEMRIIWVILCISNGNIDQKRFCVYKSSRNLSARFGWILYISKHSFFEKGRFETLPNITKRLIYFFGFKKRILQSKTNGHLQLDDTIHFFFDGNRWPYYICIAS